MVITTTQSFRFQIGDGATVDVGVLIPWGTNSDGSAAPQLIPDAAALDPEFIAGVASGAIQILTMPALIGISSGESLGTATITSP